MPVIRVIDRSELPSTKAATARFRSSVVSLFMTSLYLICLSGQACYLRTLKLGGHTPPSFFRSPLQREPQLTSAINMDGDDATSRCQLRQQDCSRRPKGAKYNLPAAVTAGIGSHVE